MTTPMMRRLSVQEAENELHSLEQGVEGGIASFEERARFHDLSPREQGVWERIRELRWLLSRG